MKIKFYTLGCKVNQYESQALQEEFKNSGFSITDGVADIYVINSCSVTAKADSDSRRLIAKAKKENPGAKIAVCGCWPQLNAEEAKQAGADYVIPQDEKQNLLEMITGRKETEKNIWSLKINTFKNQRAFVKIQDGCNNFCSFCKVPHVRGRSISRPENDIINEIKRLEEKHREIVLCGVNMGLYGKDLASRSSLYDLLGKILERNNLGRLRLSSLEPYSVSKEIIGLFTHRKMCPHIHLPFQNGDNRVLKEMNKKETVEMYEQIVNDLRTINPQIAISCDIIAGFPGEDETSFNNTVNFLKKIKPMRTHVFTFSPREKTRFYGKKMNTEKVRKRFKQLKTITDALALNYKRGFIGKKLNVVVEEIKSGQVCGYSENYIRVQTKCHARQGDIVTVTVTKIEKNNVFGIVSEKTNAS
jgi:threonylcarbamoyladenosine tRNA methylthiotransferase MtaB